MYGFIHQSTKVKSISDKHNQKEKKYNRKLSWLTSRTLTLIANCV